MKTASVRELRSEFPKLLAWVDAGEEVVITKRRKVVAKLSPATDSSESKAPPPDFAARRQKIFGDAVIPQQVMQDILDENRGRY